MIGAPCAAGVEEGAVRTLNQLTQINNEVSPVESESFFYPDLQERKKKKEKRRRKTEKYDYPYAYKCSVCADNIISDQVDGRALRRSSS